MGTEKKQNNRTSYVRRPRDEQHPYNILPSNIYQLDGYQLAIMAQILSNKDGWNIVKYEIAKRLGFPRQKFNAAWNSLIKLGYIDRKRIQGGYDYTIYEDPSFTSTTGSICENSTSTTGRHCAGGIQTTTNTNYYREVTTTTDSQCKENQFKELFALYPSQGTRPDGTTYRLKSKRSRCEKAYSDYLKENKMSHAEIMTALQVELNERRMTGKTHYQPGLLKWIEDRVFEQYRGLTIEPYEPKYGEKFV